MLSRLHLFAAMLSCEAAIPAKYFQHFLMSGNKNTRENDLCGEQNEFEEEIHVKQEKNICYEKLFSGVKVCVLLMGGKYV